jgi:arsenate reductase
LGIRILFVCTGNSCRSQMAEAWTRVLLGDVFDPHSAGIVPHGLDRHAVKVMAEAGVDITRHRSKVIDEFSGSEFDRVVTLSARARAALSSAPGQCAVTHAGVESPRKEQAGIPAGSDGLEDYRRVRDEIKAFVASLVPLKGGGS